MSFTIAVAGKGGTGKTTICGLLIRYINNRFNTPVLAIDADPNMNLNEVLGVKVQQTIGSIREKTKDEKENSSSMSKIEYLDLMINQALIEGERVDLLVMGRPEGAGCYCAANHLIRRAVDRLSNNYEFVIIDNEAGMEHLSRQTTKNVDMLFIISDSSWRSFKSAIRIKEIVKELNLNIKNYALIINRSGENIPVEYKDEIKKNELSFLGVLPEDEMITQYDIKGIPLAQLPPDSKMVRSLYRLLDSLVFKN